MIPEKMLELLILETIVSDYSDDMIYAEYMDKHYDMQKLGDRYDELGKEFLTPYAIDKTEKSD